MSTFLKLILFCGVVSLAIVVSVVTNAAGKVYLPTVLVADTQFLKESSFLVVKGEAFERELMQYTGKYSAVIDVFSGFLNALQKNNLDSAKGMLLNQEGLNSINWQLSMYVAGKELWSRIDLKTIVEIDEGYYVTVVMPFKKGHGLPIDRAAYFFRVVEKDGQLLMDFNIGRDIPRGYLVNYQHFCEKNDIAVCVEPILDRYWASLRELLGSVKIGDAMTWAFVGGSDDPDQEIIRAILRASDMPPSELIKERFISERSKDVIRDRLTTLGSYNKNEFGARYFVNPFPKNMKYSGYRCLGARCGLYFFDIENDTRKLNYFSCETNNGERQIVNLLTSVQANDHIQDLARGLVRK